MKRITSVSILIGMGLLVMGCAGPDSEVPSPEVSGGVSPTTSQDSYPEMPGSGVTASNTPVPGQPASTPEEVIDPDTGETHLVYPPSTEASRAEVIAAAERVITAFARPDLDFDTWFAELEPLLGQDTAMDYVDVDPARIPASRITGSATIVTDYHINLATVDVPTNAGTYRLHMRRDSGDSPWLCVEFMHPKREPLGGGPDGGSS